MYGYLNPHMLLVSVHRTFVNYFKVIANLNPYILGNSRNLNASITEGLRTVELGYNVMKGTE